MTNDTTIQTPAGPVRAGSRIQYRPFSGPVRTVTVEYVSQDIKNERAGFDGDSNEGAVWGYADQVTRVISR